MIQGLASYRDAARTGSTTFQEWSALALGFWNGGVFPARQATLVLAWLRGEHSQGPVSPEPAGEEAQLFGLDIWILASVQSPCHRGLCSPLQGCPVSVQSALVVAFFFFFFFNTVCPSHGPNWVRI